MMSPLFFPILTWWFCLAHPTFVRATSRTLPNIHRRGLSPTLVQLLPTPPTESAPCDRLSEIALVTPARPTQHRRVRNIKSVFYWSAVFTMLAGGAVAMISLLLHTAGLCPSFCYRTAGCDGDDNIESQKVARVKHPRRHGWWWIDCCRFRSSSDKTTSTDGTSSTDSASVHEEEIACHDSSRSLSHDNTVIVKDGAPNDRDEENFPCHDAAVAELTIDEAATANNFHSDQHLPEDHGEDHTILVDVYRHYVYKGDNEDDTYNFDFGIQLQSW